MFGALGSGPLGPFGLEKIDAQVMIGGIIITQESAKDTGSSNV